MARITKRNRCRSAFLSVAILDRGGQRVDAATVEKRSIGARRIVAQLIVACVQDAACVFKLVLRLSWQQAARKKVQRSANRPQLVAQARVVRIENANAILERATFSSRARRHQIDDSTPQR